MQFFCPAPHRRPTSGRCILTAVAHTSLFWLFATALPAQTPNEGPAAPDASATPLPDEPTWWKGNLHTHTLWSDGNDFPEMIADWYRTHGYNFLALSDHNILSSGQRWMSTAAIQKRGGPEAVEKYLRRFGPHWVETRRVAAESAPSSELTEIRLKPLDEFRALLEQSGQFIMIPGEEISDSVAGAPVHMNATNLQDLIQPLGGPTVSAAIEANLRAAEDQAERTGREILVHLNHPNFGWAVTAEDIAHAVSEQYFEVFNGHPGVGHLGDDDHPPVERLWDIANTIRIAQLRTAPLMGLATDDSHNYHDHTGSITGRGWVMVRAYYLTPESILRAMRDGDFYASSGVILNDVRYDPATRIYQLEIKAQAGATYSTEFIGTRNQFDPQRQPRTKGPDDQRRLTQRYSSDVGTVLARVAGTQPAYQLTGDELYVRAVVTSSAAHPRASFAGQLEQAWTQPIGWQARLESAPSGD